VTREVRNALITGMLAVVAASGAALCREQAHSQSDPSNRPVQVREDGYTSSQACQACHPDQYASWHASYHRTMTQLATPQTARANFDGVTVPNVHGRPMRLEQQGNRLWAELDDPDASHDP
jgi:hypothetical protein